MESLVKDTVAEILGIDLPDAHVDGSYSSIPGWSSSMHIRLLLGLKRKYGKPVPEFHRSAQTTLRDIVGYFTGQTSAKQAPPTREICRGLEGIAIDYTEISKIEASGTLEYRGTPIEEVFRTGNYLQTVELLLGERCHFAGRDSMSASPARAGQGRLSLVDLKQRLSTLRLSPDLSASEAYEGVLRHVLADWRGTDVAGALYAQLTGTEVTEEDRPALERTLLLLAEHGACASTFAARVAASTEAPLGSALLAALCVFEGPLHGGAVSQVTSECGGSRTIRYGTGHRIYLVPDPRAALLKSLLNNHFAAPVEGPAPGENSDAGVHVNVDFYLSHLLGHFGILGEGKVLFFFLARLPGIIAHYFEQRANNVLIRPLLLSRS